jgi:hypothetical protein
MKQWKNWVGFVKIKFHLNENIEWHATWIKIKILISTWIQVKFEELEFNLEITISTLNSTRIEI